MSDKYCINLNNGFKINIELFPDKAPVTVENFKRLAGEGFYTGLCFHRVIPSFMIQGGGFFIADGQLNQKQAPAIVGEFRSNQFDNDLKHTAGTISMARTRDKNSASSQFFICVADCAYLDGEYAAFGRVLDKESLDAAVAVSRVKTGMWMNMDDVPIQPVVIESVTEIL
ncbi:MAG: peptidylprolyl isomerase [Firmicutes bacterium]|nr:peptidylprolyl isomerase [Bacillota bacterium]